MAKSEHSGSKQGPSSTKTGAKKISATERRRRALELRAAGATFEAIANALGYSRAGAYKAVTKALRDTLQEPADEVRRLELRRLDAVLGPAYTAARGGDLQALDRVLKVMERRARLLGLDLPAPKTPQPIEISGPGGGPVKTTNLEALTVAELEQLRALVAKTEGEGEE